jgi:hypothetical protein
LSFPSVPKKKARLKVAFENRLACSGHEPPEYMRILLFWTLSLDPVIVDVGLNFVHQGILGKPEGKSRLHLERKSYKYQLLNVIGRVLVVLFLFFAHAFLSRVRNQ